MNRKSQDRQNIIDSDVAKASTLPSGWYLDEAVLNGEIDQLFRKTWQLVAKTADLPESGSYFTTELCGEPLVLTRDRSGTLHAFYNVCRHRGGPVALGCGVRQALQCAYHGWTYALDGTLLSTREMDGTENFDKAGFGLAPIPIASWGPLIFVNLDTEALPFEHQFGAIIREVEEKGFHLETMAAVERRDYHIACNWKVYVDNYLEGYHIPIVHPGLFLELDYERYEVVTFDNYSKQFAPVRAADSQSSDRRYSRYTKTGEEEAAQALYYWVFPNLMLNIYPDNVSTNVIRPQGTGRTLTLFEWFANPGTPTSDMRQTIDFSEEIQQEDIFICEHVQKGLTSRSYDRGRYSAKRENGVHHFHRLIAAALSDLTC